MHALCRYSSLPLLDDFCSVLKRNCTSTAAFSAQTSPQTTFHLWVSLVCLYGSCIRECQIVGWILFVCLLSNETPNQPRSCSNWWIQINERKLATTQLAPTLWPLAIREDLRRARKPKRNLLVEETGSEEFCVQTVTQADSTLDNLINRLNMLLVIRSKSK